jgi:hypothetical protein
VSNALGSYIPLPEPPPVPELVPPELLPPPFRLPPLNTLPVVERPLEPPSVLLLEPVVELALDPVVELPLEPTTGELGATGAVLGLVLPLKVLGGLPFPSGATLVALGPVGWTMGGRARVLPEEGPPRAMHSLIQRVLCCPIYSCNVACCSHATLLDLAAIAVSEPKSAPPATTPKVAKRMIFDILYLRIRWYPSSSTNPVYSGFVLNRWNWRIAFTHPALR